MPDTPADLQHLLRVGWSVASQSYDLGEEQYSYGYGGTGKSSCNNRFADYGQRFGAGDVITCYLDLESSRKTVSFAKNGAYLGTCFSLDAGVVARGGPLFPHVFCKNVVVRANFGSSQPTFPILGGYRFIEHLDRQCLEHGPEAPRSQSECEVIMMVGVPASGKTTWANGMVQKFPEKRYNVVGTNNIMDKMKIMGLNRKRNYHGRFDALMDEASKVHSKLLQIAQKCSRNFILDQTNVYGTAQKRKIANFKKFGKRCAAVVVVTKAELERRREKREREEGKLVPEEAVMEMKANFTVPTKGVDFDCVDFVEENEESTQRLVKQFREEAAEFFRLNPTKKARHASGRGGPHSSLSSLYGTPPHTPSGHGRPHSAPCSPYSTPLSSPYSMPPSSPYSLPPSPYHGSPSASPHHMSPAASPRQGSEEPYSASTPGSYSRESSVDPYHCSTREGFVDPYRHGAREGSVDACSRGTREGSVDPYNRGIPPSLREGSMSPYGRGAPLSSQKGSMDPYGRGTPSSSREGSMDPYGRSPSLNSQESSARLYGHDFSAPCSSQEASLARSDRDTPNSYLPDRSAQPYGRTPGGYSSRQGSSVLDTRDLVPSYDQPSSEYGYPPASRGGIPPGCTQPAPYGSRGQEHGSQQGIDASHPYEPSRYGAADMDTRSRSTPAHYQHTRPVASPPYNAHSPSRSSSDYGQQAPAHSPYSQSPSYHGQPPSQSQRPYGQGSSAPSYSAPSYGHQQYAPPGYGSYR